MNTIDRSYASPDRRCVLCHGSVGRLDENGAHVLCAARLAHGMPTPSLGEMCLACRGIGRVPRSAVGPVNPTQAAIEAWAPKCSACNGTGKLEVRR